MKGICGFIDFGHNYIVDGDNGGFVCGSDVHRGEHTVFIQLSDTERIIHRTVGGYDFSIIFCGELTNTQELFSKIKKYGYAFLSCDDAEAALFAYIHYGEKCAEHLEGSFVFTIHDCMRQRVFLCRDLYGSLPFLYCLDNNCMVFSTSEKKLFEMRNATAQIETEGLRSIFGKGHLCGFLKNTFELPAGHFMIVSRRGICMKQHGDVKISDALQENAKKTIPILRTLLKDIVAETLEIESCNIQNSDFEDFAINLKMPCSDCKKRLFDILGDTTAPITALCDTEKIKKAVDTAQTGDSLAQFLVIVNETMRDVRIV